MLIASKSLVFLILCLKFKVWTSNQYIWHYSESSLNCRGDGHDEKRWQDSLEAKVVECQSLDASVLIGSGLVQSIILGQKSRSFHRVTLWKSKRASSSPALSLTQFFKIFVLLKLWITIFNFSRSYFSVFSESLRALHCIGFMVYIVCSWDLGTIWACLGESVVVWSFWIFGSLISWIFSLIWKRISIFIQRVIRISRDDFPYSFRLCDIIAPRLSFSLHQAT